MREKKRTTRLINAEIHFPIARVNLGASAGASVAPISRRERTFHARTRDNYAPITPLCTRSSRSSSSFYFSVIFPRCTRPRAIRPPSPSARQQVATMATIAVGASARASLISLYSSFVRRCSGAALRFRRFRKTSRLFPFFL